MRLWTRALDRAQFVVYCGTRCEKSIGNRVVWTVDCSSGSGSRPGWRYGGDREQTPGTTRSQRLAAD